MSDPTVGAAIAKDAGEGAGIKVNGTPRTYINGRLFSGVLSEDLLDFVIKIELGQVTGKDAETYAPKGE
jgi:protein-disulfide isomerase